MTWEEFKQQRPSEGETIKNFAETIITCPCCGEKVWVQTNVILTSNPPQRRFRCFKCGWVGAG